MTDVKKIIADVIATEGGYVNNINDKGGATNFGITEAVARAYGYQGDMKVLPKSIAEDIYTGRYISAPGFDKVLAISDSIGAELIDTGVNMGPGVASTLLQRALNGFNIDGAKYPELFPDGKLGAQSLSALQSFIAWRGVQGEKIMVRLLNSLQAARYLDITENNKSQRTFLYGWIANRVS